MKHVSLLVVAGSILTAAILCMASTPPDPSRELLQVKQPNGVVDSSRQQVGSIERQRKDPFLIVPRDGKDNPMIIRPSGPHGPSRKGWRPFEFNGMTYYIVPCGTPKVPAQQPGASQPSPK